MDPVEIPPGHEHGGHVTFAPDGATLVLIEDGNAVSGAGSIAVASGGGGDEAPIAGEGEGNEPPAACAAGYLAALVAVGTAVVNIKGGRATFGAAAV